MEGLQYTEEYLECVLTGVFILGSGLLFMLSNYMYFNLDF